MGDSHVEFIDPTVVEATFGAPAWSSALRPENLVYHDVLDLYSGTTTTAARSSPTSPSTARPRQRRGELDRTLGVHRSPFFRPCAQEHLRPSNHVDALARWVEETDPRTDLENCVFWAETFKAMADATEMTPTGAATIDPFIYWAKQEAEVPTAPCSCRRDESHLIHGIEVGFHGDAGPNGSRGTRNGLYQDRRQVRSSATATAPASRTACYQVGTSSSRMGLEYQRGPSSWLHTHCNSC
jgi:hypothetical protein